jgi:hypothetical protein
VVRSLRNTSATLIHSAPHNAELVVRRMNQPCSHRVWVSNASDIPPCSRVGMMPLDTVHQVTLEPAFGSVAASRSRDGRRVLSYSSDTALMDDTAIVSMSFDGDDPQPVPIMIQH